MVQYLQYNRSLKLTSRELRNNSTLSEIILWNILKSKRMKGYQFTRQKPIGNFIVDFYCSKLKLVVEIDGNSHDSNKFKYDKERGNILKSFGLEISRFSDLDVKKDISRIALFLQQWIDNKENLPL